MNNLHFKNDTKRLCIMAMLIAIAVVLSMLSLRIGPAIKISFKFMPVFLCSVLFGPLGGALCGGISDFLGYFVNPGSGPWMWQITLVEILYGISFGLFFKNTVTLSKKVFIKILICLFVNTIILGILLMSYILKDLMGVSYFQMILIRIPSSLVNMLIHFFGISVILKYLKKFF